MDIVLDYNGSEISNIPVINRPSYFLVNNYGRESYMTILEPIGEFKITPERKLLANNYKSVAQLVQAFRKQAPVGDTESGYSRKDTMEVYFMGFTWRWRPNHKSFYGGISAGYELLPLIARWVVLTGVTGSIDNNSPDYLPIKYNGGTGKGFGGMEIGGEASEVKPEEVNSHVANVTEIAYSNKLYPIVHTLAGGMARAAQLNVIPKEAYQAYDELLKAFSSNIMSFKASTENKYALTYTTDGTDKKFVGALCGGGELPSWAKLISATEHNGYLVKLVDITASDIKEADNLMASVEASGK